MSHRHNKKYDLTFTFNFRCSSQWPDRKILCISHLATCSSRGKDWTCSQISEGRTWNTNVAVCPGNVHASPVQHLPSTLSSDVYICHFRHELLHDSQVTWNLGRSLQFPDVWSEHDPPVPDVDLGWLGRCPQWHHGRERLWTRLELSNPQTFYWFSKLKIARDKPQNVHSPSTSLFVLQKSKQSEYWRLQFFIQSNFLAPRLTLIDTVFKWRLDLM